MSENQMLSLSTIMALVFLVALVGWAPAIISAVVWSLWLLLNVAHTVGSVHKEASDNA